MFRVGLWFLYEPSQTFFGDGYPQSSEYVINHIHALLCELYDRDLIEDFSEFHANVSEVENG